MSLFRLLPFLLQVLAVPQQGSSSSSSVATATPSPSAPSSPLPSQAPLPPKQAWCPSSIFCAGALLQSVNLAQVFPDSKTFVDKPTNKSSATVLQDYANLGVENGTATQGSISQFVASDFKGEGQELNSVSITLPPNPPLLQEQTIPNQLVRAYTGAIHNIWSSLIRNTSASALQCSQGNSSDCESSLIPLNHTFVVPGGRFREQYYWDSYWIILGLIQSQLYAEVNSTLQNFMDELDTIGFIPNGGRVYYLNRSQPPLFIRMLWTYLRATNDTSILTRAIPLAEKELAWWKRERSVTVSGNQLYQYRVNNSAPRPESYYEDYLVTNGDDLPSPTFYNDSQRNALWAELATGAESGWDYSTRWLKQIPANGTNNTVALRTLNIRGIVPVDLNAILYDAHIKLADVYESSDIGNRTVFASSHRGTASTLKSAILSTFWDKTKLGFYDYNLTSSSLSPLFSAASFYPLWLGITPTELLSNATAARGFFASVSLVLSRYNGTYPATFIESGLQWDSPNTWPPHQYVIFEALRNLPKNVSDGAIELPFDGANTWGQIPPGQLGITEDGLPAQPKEGGEDYPRNGSGADVNLLKGGDGSFAGWYNGGNGTVGSTKLGWRDALVSGLANRYVTSALCSWHASGGSIPDLLPALPDDQRLPGSEGLSGLMFEKFSVVDVDSAGRGGEYTVQAGFGWTNGVLLWIGGNLGEFLQTPTCPVSSSRGSGGSSTLHSAGIRVGPSAGLVGVIGVALVHLTIGLVL